MCIKLKSHNHSIRKTRRIHLTSEVKERPEEWQSQKESHQLTNFIISTTMHLWITSLIEVLHTSKNNNPISW